MKATIGVVAMQKRKRCEMYDDDDVEVHDDDDVDKSYQVTMAEPSASSGFLEEHYAPNMVVRSVGIFQTRCVIGLQLSFSDGGAQPAVMIATNTQK